MSIILGHHILQGLFSCLKSILWRLFSCVYFIACQICGFPDSRHFPKVLVFEALRPYGTCSLLFTTSWIVLSVLCWRRDICSAVFPLQRWLSSYPLYRMSIAIQNHFGIHLESLHPHSRRFFPHEFLVLLVVICTYKFNPLGPFPQLLGCYFIVTLLQTFPHLPPILPTSFFKGCIFFIPYFCKRDKSESSERFSHSLDRHHYHCSALSSKASLTDRCLSPTFIGIDGQILDRAIPLKRSTFAAIVQFISHPLLWN